MLADYVLAERKVVREVCSAEAEQGAGLAAPMAGVAFYY